MLDNISVGTIDLEKVVPNIETYLFSDQTDFSSPITISRKKVFRRIKADLRNRYPGYSPSEIETALGKVEDLTDETNLKDSIVRYAISEIFRANQSLELAEVYLAEAESIPLEYHYDDDEDNSLDEDEEYYAYKTGVVLGR